MTPPTAVKAPKKTPAQASGIRDDAGKLVTDQKRLHVWFESTVSELPIESSNYEYFGQGSKLKKVKVEGLHLSFSRLGTTRPYNPLKPADAKIIERVRKWLESDDDRIRQFRVREVRQNAGAAPFPKWDETKPKAIAELVKTGGWDIDKCIKYEQLTLCRPEVIRELERLAVSLEDAPAPKTLEADLG